MLNRPDKNISYDWRYCPRCFKPNDKSTWEYTINKFERKCKKCNGYVQFAGDDGRLLDERLDWYFVFHRSVFNRHGYFDKSYWRDNHNIQGSKY